MNYTNIIFLIIVLVFDISIISAQDNKWILKKNKNGIIIHTREDEATGNIEFKASITLNTDIDKLLNVFNNVEDYKKWMADTKVSKTLKKVNETESYIYLEAQVPWPLENRDMPVYQKTIKTNKGIKISLTGIPDYIPCKKGITRIEKATGSWIFIPVPNNKIIVKYQFLCDPGLNIPKWIINLFIVDGPYKTLINLKAIVEH